MEHFRAAAAEAVKGLWVPCAHRQRSAQQLSSARRCHSM